jgi:hypothetical protein
MLFLLVLIGLAYWFIKIRKRSQPFLDISSAEALDADEVQLLVARVPKTLKRLQIFGEPGCEYDVFVNGLSVIPHPVLGGTTTLVRPDHSAGDEDLMVVQKKNITMERMIVPSVVRFF